MAQEVKYLSYSGLSHLKDILEGRYEKKGHTHSYLPLSGGTMTGVINSQSVIPTTTNTYNLGSSSLKWANVYAINIYGKLNGDITGNATSLGGGHSITVSRSKLTYLSGQYTNNTTETAGQIYIGSSANWDVISSPLKDGTDTLCNIMSMRMAFNSSFWHEIATTPNNDEFYHRSVRSNSVSDWRTILDSVNYSNYALPKRGGTITGLLTIKRSPSAIHFNNSAGTKLGYLGINADDDPVAYKADGTTMRHILHSGNYSSYALPLTGGTLTGNLTIKNKTLKITDEKYIVFDNPRYAENKGAWAITQLTFRGPADSDGNTPNIYSLGAFGSNNVLDYIYIGANSYSSNKNLRIYPNGNVSAASFTGNLTGNVTGHLNGTVSMTGGNGDAYRNILVTNGSNGICYSSLNNVQLNYATGDVKATSFTGNLTGNVTGNVTGSSGSCTGNAATATKASTVTIAANSADVACELFFQSSGRSSAAGTMTYDNDLRYNPSKNTLMMGGMSSSTASPTSANIVLDGTNKKLSLGESYIQYNSSTGCLEIIA